MNVARPSRLATLALGAFMLACSSDSPVAPTTQPASLGQIFSEMTLSKLGGIASPVSATPAASLAGPVPSTCSFSAASESFVCPTVTLSGLTLAQSYTLFDASGKPQSQFDPSKAASVRVRSAIAGTFSDGHSNLTMDQQQDMTLSGLLTGSHLLNGTSVMKMSGTVMAGGTAGYSGAISHSAIVNLVPPKDASGWPASGTITSDISTSLEPGISGAVIHLEMTFNGTSKVAMVITAFGLTQHCTLDLSNPAAACI